MADLIAAAKPDFRIYYGGGDETVLMDPYTVRVSVTDHLTGQADEAEMVLEDRDGVFLGSYFPKRGDDFSLSLGWEGGDLPGLWSMGGFSIDEAQVNGPPDQLVIRGLSTSVKAEQRSPRTRAYESCTFDEIVTKVGEAMGYAVVPPGIDLVFNRMTQARETDLGFLHRIATAHGCTVKVKGGQIVVQKLERLMGIASDVGIARADVIRYSIRSKTAETQRATVSRYWDPTKRDQVAFLTAEKVLGAATTHPVPAPNGRGPKPAARTSLGLFGPKVDVAKVFDRVENAAQAQARMDASQLWAVVGNVEGSIELLGDPRIRAGSNVYLFPEDWGALGSWYVVKRVKHTLSRQQGFTTELDICHNPSGAAKKPMKKVTLTPRKSHK